MPDVYIRTVMLMSTWVTIQVVGHAADQQQDIDRRERVDRAFEWFRQVEECCTRFDPQSELMRLSTQVGVPVPMVVRSRETRRGHVAARQRFVHEADNW